METPVARGKDLHRVGRIAMAIGLAFVLGGVGVGPALAGGGGYDHGNNGERHEAPRHEEHHDHDRHAPPPNYYYAPPPNYYYAPPPVYYQPPPVYYAAPPQSEGWTFIFP